MSSSLATKYRPKKISQLVGQKHIKEQLKGMIKSGKIPPAILIVGETGSGKTTIARMVARYVNCENGNACGECESCVAIDKGMNNDVIEINAASDGNKDEAKNLIKKAQFKPKYRYKVIIIDEIHAATYQSVQALLKPIEEPPANTLWILCTTNPEKLPEPIIGRCLNWIIERIEDKDLYRFINQIFKKEKVIIPDKELKKIYSSIVKASLNRPRNILKVIDSLLLVLPEDRTLTLDIVNKTLPDTLSAIMGQDDSLLAMEFLVNLYSFVFSKNKAVPLDKCINIILQIKSAVGFIGQLLYYNKTALQATTAREAKTQPKFNYYQRILIKNVSKTNLTLKSDKLLHINTCLVNLKKEIHDFTVDAQYSFIKMLDEVSKK